MNKQSILVFDILARILMAALFIYSGFGKLMNPGAIAMRLAEGGMPLPTLAAYGAIAIELGGAVALIVGFRLVLTCAVLAGFTVLATVMFHPFWAIEGAARVGQTIQFLKNACILAGLWFIVRSALAPSLSAPVTTDGQAASAGPR
jgi:putative oxidoreductase